MKWIDIKDKLPPKNKEILFLSKSCRYCLCKALRKCGMIQAPGVRIGTFCEYKEQEQLTVYSFKDDIFCIKFEVTHWFDFQKKLDIFDKWLYISSRMNEEITMGIFEIKLDTSIFKDVFAQGNARIKGIKEWAKILEKATEEEIIQIVNNIKKSLKNIKSISRKKENDICNCILALKSIGVYL